MNPPTVTFLLTSFVLASCLPGPKGVPSMPADKLTEIQARGTPAIDDLALGDGRRLDAVLTILPKARHAIQAGKPLKLMDEFISFEYACVTLDRSSKRDSTGLLDEITARIQQMHRTGLLKKLSLRYQGLDLTQEAAQFELASIDPLS